MAHKSTSWGKVSAWYDNLLEEKQDSYQEKVIKPNLLRLLMPKPGEEVLDIGCGQGFFSREIAKNGARVVGIDIAGELISLAKKRAKHGEIFLNLSAENMKGLNSERFNAAICVLALQNIENYRAAIMEAARVLKVNGRFILVLNHPGFRVPTASAWEFDQEKKVQFRRIDKYLSEIKQAVDMTQGILEQRKKRYTYSFHRPLQNYFKVFKKAGLAVIGLEEWISHKVSDKGSRKAAEDLARKEIPLFMALEIVKYK